MVLSCFREQVPDIAVDSDLIAAAIAGGEL